MHETAVDVHWLQDLLDRSHAGMGAHMASIVTPERRLTARQVVAYLDGVKHVALATVTSGGEPRVGPLDALFIRGRFHVGTASAAVRVRHLRRQPRVSVTHFAGDEIAVTVHGTAVLMARDHPDVATLEPIWVGIYGMSPFDMADDVVLIRIEPDAMYAYAS